MREKKFRVWSNFYNDWVESFCIKDGRVHLGTAVYTGNQVEDAVLLQYTGLKDKNGKEIYESDKVEFNDFDSLRTGGHTEDNILQGEVCFSCGAWIIKTERGHYDLYTAIVNDEELEIIGNIYENPELLEEEK